MLLVELLSDLSACRALRPCAAWGVTSVVAASVALVAFLSLVAFLGFGSRFCFLKEGLWGRLWVRFFSMTSRIFWISF